MSIALGVDLSTQSCKCIAVNVNTLHIVEASSVVFDVDLPSYQTINGMHRSNDQPPVVTSPTIMWAEALMKCLNAMQLLPSADVIAISGSAQQHATVYWKLAQGDAIAASTLEELAAFLSVHDSPIWMNNTTGRWCEQLRSAFPNGDAGLQHVAGVRATERFSVFHVAKHLSTEASTNTTKAVSLASSFATSLLAGVVSGTDFSDASGTGALALSELDWCDAVFEHLGVPNGRTLLGALTDPTVVIGRVANSSLLSRYLKSTVDILPFTGDNPSAVVGMGLTRAGDVLVSLGTSDTCIVVGHRGDESQLPPNTYTFPHPLFPRELVCHMMVYANGDLARRRVKDAHYNGSWELFSVALNETRTDGNVFCTTGPSPKVGLSLAVNEICPPISVPPSGLDVYFDGDSLIDVLSDARYYSRLAIEHRALAMVEDIAPLLLPSSSATATSTGRLLITGGASCSVAILDVFADVFQRDVWVNDTKEAAAFGAAIRAVWGTTAEGDQRASLLQRIEAQCAGRKMTSPIKYGDVTFARNHLRRAVAALTKVS
ncbi:xylulose kinase-like, putative [Bodo saltans]|uniref:Xylulose kinase n=1 Tax=Bodo saltans TaxID=75058 RepID=A0A0S4JK25_BODSA|nr:xylulose kinase-like, putative [Bodo saltans]|eukprot:CUG90515.1 xylulose kinase-like, putative [Bodo saltans]